MKDLVEACEISRGGLYLYFSDTAEVFEAVLKEASNDLTDILKNDKDKPADVILEYLEEAKSVLTAKKNNLCAATIEYRFAIKALKRESVIKKQLSTTQNQLEKLIDSNPTFLQQCKMVLVNVCYDRYPRMINDDEIEKVTYSIVKYLFDAYGDEKGFETFKNAYNIEENQLEEYRF